MVVKTFRGLLADEEQIRIRLGTIKGKVGYKIIKLQLLSAAPMLNDLISLVSVWKGEQATVTATTINFSDGDLLAVGLWMDGDALTEPATFHTIFDNEMFNQDIYITHVDAAGTGSINYYLELEVIPLDDKGAEYTTVKDLRTRGF